MKYTVYGPIDFVMKKLKEMKYNYKYEDEYVATTVVLGLLDKDYEEIIVK